MSKTQRKLQFDTYFNHIFGIGTKKRNEQKNYNVYLKWTPFEIFHNLTHILSGIISRYFFQKKEEVEFVNARKAESL